MDPLPDRPPLRRRLRLPANASTLLIFALVALSLLGAMMLIFKTVEAERRERTQAANTSEVLAELATIHRAVLSAETGQRGYLITLDDRYLASFHVGQQAIGPSLSRLRALVRQESTPRQNELLDRVDNLTAAKFAEMSESIALISRGDVLEARSRVLSDEGQEVMDRLRLSLGEMERIEQSQLAHATSESADNESRVIPLLSMLLMLLFVALTFGYLLVNRTAKAEAEAAQAAVLGEARDRADLLAKELNHRVKNLFAVILAIVRMSGKDTPEAKPVVDRIADRIHALLSAHEVTQGAPGQQAASLRSLFETTVKPYLASDRMVDLDGPPIDLSPRQVTPLGLVLHEMTTNAVKYGCWANGGKLSVRWRRDGDQLHIDWTESSLEHAPQPGPTTERKGFGSLLMTSAARQLRGSIEREFGERGAEIVIRIPLVESHAAAG